MKIALLGKGKTGGKVIEVGELRGHEVMAFGKEAPPSLEVLKESDIVISFLPGPAYLEFIDLLIESKTPVISGSTGAELPVNLDDKLNLANIAWIHGHNFSLGMNLIHEMIQIISKADKLFDETQYAIHEVHHTHKKDAPSGTALKWQEWLQHEANITSERTGDVVGDHVLTLKTSTEEITLRHQALDRKIFAQGAVWAAEYLNQNKLEPGLHWFEDIAKRFINA